jgi:hypothetical protein
LPGVTLRSLCIEVVHASQADGSALPSVGASDLASVFAMAGIEVKPTGQECDAQMRIELIEQPLSAKYGSQHCYTGAWVTGEVVIEAAGAGELHVPIDGGVGTPFVVTSCPQDPSGAPVKVATAKGLIVAFARIWSYDFLTPVIRSQNWFNPFVNMAAEMCVDDAQTKKETVLGCLTAASVLPNSRQVNALNKLGSLGASALPAVPELIALLEVKPDGSSGPNRLFGFGRADAEAVAEALKEITGQDFGTDAGQWRQWWETRQ